MDKDFLLNKKAWLESEVARLSEELNSLTIQSHRFNGALGFVNDLIKELGNGEPAQKGEKKHGKPSRSKSTKTI